MAIGDIYKTPTVKQVIFQIVFPNFFSMETKIGDYQLKVMDRFPKSQLLIQNQFLLAKQLANKIITPPPEERIHTKKIWQFKTEKEDVTLNITMDSLDISSTKHKTYNNPGSEDKFRDTVQFVVSKFLEVIPLIRISKMGLRYVDECPLPAELTNASFLEYYNSFINFSKIDDIKNINEMDFGVVLKKGDLAVIYKEKLKKNNDVYEYNLDFDGQASNIATDQYLNTLDKMHNEITACYHDIIKEPVIKIMNQ
jgi:uncharacterized protein (TIGR04255 family)